MKSIPVKQHSGEIIQAYARFIKAVVIVFAVILSLPYIGGGYLLMQMIQNAGGDGSGWFLFFGVVIGIVVIILGKLIADVISAIYAGYGEMIENSAEIASGINYLCSVNGGVLEGTIDPVRPVRPVREPEPVRKDPRPTLNHLKAESGVVHVENATGAPVPCLYCRSTVPFGSSYCPKCGKRYSFERI